MRWPNDPEGHLRKDASHRQLCRLGVLPVETKAVTKEVEAPNAVGYSPFFKRREAKGWD
jgi:hypothetical protein